MEVKGAKATLQPNHLKILGLLSVNHFIDRAWRADQPQNFFF